MINSSILNESRREDVDFGNAIATNYPDLPQIHKQVAIGAGESGKDMLWHALCYKNKYNYV